MNSESNDESIECMEERLVQGVDDLTHSLWNALHELQDFGFQELSKDGIPKTSASQLLKITSPTETQEWVGEDINSRIENCYDCALAKTRERCIPVSTDSFARPLKICIVLDAPDCIALERQSLLAPNSFALLLRMMKALNVAEDEFIVTSWVRCRPPNDRDVALQENLACRKHLESELYGRDCKSILALGERSAALALMHVANSKNTQTIAPGIVGREDPRSRLSSIETLRHMVDVKVDTIPLFATFHPEDLIHRPELKKPAWEDLKRLRSSIGLR